MDSQPLPASTTEETERKDTWFVIKRINFFGRQIPIILQNHNGPCPLIAICNVLSLTNNLQMSWNMTHVSQDMLVQFVRYQVMDSIIKRIQYDYAKDQDEIYYEAHDLVPKLTTGIDVNVKFRRIDDFELTAECAIFDLLHIPLYHGWLVDPQDRETSEALGSKSYNTLMEELAHLETVLRKNKEEDTVDIVAEKAATLVVPSPCVSSDQSFGKSPRNVEDSVDIVAATTESLGVPSPCVSSCQTLGESPQKKKKWDIAFESNLLAFTGDDLVPFAEGVDGLNLHQFHLATAKSETERHDPKEADSTFEFVEPGSFQDDCDERVSAGLRTSTADSDSLIHKVDEPESYTAKVYSNELVCEGEERSKDKLSTRQGELVKNFMQNNSTQLTVFGLSCLHEEMREYDICVFFRNNHFNTMIKLDGELYILVTDQGYANQPDLVWEKLNEVNGNTLFMTGDFKEFRLDDHSNSSGNEPKAITTTDVSGSKELDSEDLSNNWWDNFDEPTNTDDKPAAVKDESQENSSLNDDLQLAMALQEMEYEQQGYFQEPTVSNRPFW